MSILDQYFYNTSHYGINWLLTGGLVLCFFLYICAGVAYGTYSARRYRIENPDAGHYGESRADERAFWAGLLWPLVIPFDIVISNGINLGKFIANLLHK